MQLHKHNLLKTRAIPYVRSIAQQYKQRHPFAYKQQLSSAVTLQTVYNDDADICFMFTVQHNNTEYTVDVYCNYMYNYCTGHVYNTQNATLAAQLLATHFNLQLQFAEADRNNVYYNTVAV
jgi:hypothetical protein